MSTSPSIVALCAALALAAGCSSEALPPDAGDAGSDAAPDAPSDADVPDAPPPPVCEVHPSLVACNDTDPDAGPLSGLAYCGATRAFCCPVAGLDPLAWCCCPDVATCGGTFPSGNPHAIDCVERPPTTPFTTCDAASDCPATHPLCCRSHTSDGDGGTLLNVCSDHALVGWDCA